MNHKPLTVRVPIELENPSIQRIEELCINCGMCSNVCTNDIAVHGTYTFSQTNNEAVCINCGQCANVCPVNSIIEKYEYPEVQTAIENPNKIVIFSTSPSVRVALGEEFGMKDGSFVQGKMVSLLRSLGADYVLDTNFAADLTIVEEASELIERLIKKEKPLPQFTSCCPAWVKYVETYYPEMKENLSSAKSPIGMQGPTIKTYFSKKMGIDPANIVNVAVTPCTAKKYEIRRDEMNAAGEYLGIDNMRDMDHVITTRELAKWAKEQSIDFSELKDSKFDSLLGEASGAGVIFGNTGGVMEAALRTAYEYITKESAPNILFEASPVRGYDGIREASIQIQDMQINVAICHGTSNAKQLIEFIKSGEKNYHFVEVMTCPGGCIGGGGQPKNMLKNKDTVRKARIESLYDKDKQMKIRKSHENPDILKVYEDFYGKPLSELAEKMLHTMYVDRSEILKRGPVDEVELNKIAPVKKTTPAEAKEEVKTEETEKWICTVCGYIHEGLMTDDFLCPACFQGPEVFERYVEQPKIVTKVEVKEEVKSEETEKWICTVCGYIHEGPMTDDFLCPACFQGPEAFEKI